MRLSSDSAARYPISGIEIAGSTIAQILERHGIEPDPQKRRGIRVVPYDAVAGVREFTALSLAVEAATLRVPIAARFAMSDAARAHERLAQGHVLGKIVLRSNKHKSA